MIARERRYCLHGDGYVSCVWLVPVHGPLGFGLGGVEREKGIRWMPWHQEAMKDVARCEKPWGAASRL